VAIGPRKGEVVEGIDPEEPPVQLEGDAITLIFWEKAAEVIYWDGERFKTLTIAD
jgi:hypothetical protein